jgi:hypothetical protein
MTLPARLSPAGWVNHLEGGALLTGPRDAFITVSGVLTDAT